jgi:hypothetical protein
MQARQRSSATRRNRRAIAARLGVVAVALLLAACQASSASAPPPGSPSAPPFAIGSPPPSAAPSLPSANPSPNPSAPAPSAPVATPTPKPVPATWSKAVGVQGLESCNSVVAAVDELGGRHLAATCGDAGGALRYASSTGGAGWTVTDLAPPAGRFELDPQLAFAGGTLYLAYTRVAPTDGGCGDDGLDDVGVWYRTRSLPGGSWSEPVRLGVAADHLQALRVSGTTVHATVANDRDGTTYYESLSGSTLRRHAIAGATGSTSLRIGDDGRPRIAYATAKGIAYGSVNGGTVAATTIPKSAGGHSPVLTLGPGNVAYVLWTESYTGGGCIDPEPLPTFGTYIATNAGGSWTSSRLTTMVGSASLTIDPATGEVHVLVSDLGRLVYFHRPAGGAWAKETLSRQFPSSVVIRQDPTNGSLLAAYVADENDESRPMHVVVAVRQ